MATVFRVNKQQHIELRRLMRQHYDANTSTAAKHAWVVKGETLTTDGFAEFATKELGFHVSPVMVTTRLNGIAKSRRSDYVNGPAGWSGRKIVSRTPVAAAASTARTTANAADKAIARAAKRITDLADHGNRLKDVESKYATLQSNHVELERRFNSLLDSLGGI